MNSLFPEYQDLSLEDFQVRDPSQQEVLQTVRSYLGDLKANRVTGRGLTFMGAAGVGKTYLAEMVLKQAHQERYTIESITVATLVQMHQKLFGKLEDDYELASVEHQIERLQYQTDFVLFDDVGREYDSGSGWASQILFNVVRDRYNRKLPFLVTTNLPLPKLEVRYTESFVSMLHGKTDIFWMQGEDYRKWKVAY